MYYAFYAPGASGKSGGAMEKWSGELELRGLGDKTYRVMDYVNGKEYGTVTGPNAKMKAEFAGSLLLEVKPQ